MFAIVASTAAGAVKMQDGWLAVGAYLFYTITVPYAEGDSALVGQSRLRAEAI